eukprot:g10343.t1
MVRARLKPLFGLAVLLIVPFITLGKKAKRWTYPRPQWPVPEHRMDAEPCRFFVWNMASAARFCECSRLLEFTADKTLWEDSHRQLWLRIPFSSPLLRLFPCQQHSLTRCAKCGHEYRAHVEHALKKTKDRPYDQVVLKMTQQARRKQGVPWFQDYRGASVFSAKKNARGNAVSAAAAAAATGRSSTGLKGVGDESGNGSDGDGAGNNCEEDLFLGWRKRLAVLAEVQRGTLLQLAGVHVTSAAARAAFKVERDARLRAEASVERADRKRDRSASMGGAGSGGGTRSNRYGDGRRGVNGVRGGGRVRRGRSDRARRGGGSADSRGKGETEDEVAERNLRAFDRMEYI